LQEIKKLKDEYLTAAYKEGKEVDLTKEEKSKFEKADRPIDTADGIKANVDTLKSQYFDIAKKLGFNNELQGEITLLNDEISHYKKIRQEKESEKKPIDAKLSSIVQDKARTKTDDLTTLEKLKKDEAEYSKKLKKIQRPLDKMTKLIDKYEKYIKKIKLLKKEEELIPAKKIFEEELEKIQNDDAKENEKEEEEADEQIIKTGGKSTRKRKNKRRRNTKRLLKRLQNKNRTLRRRGQRRRKYTR